MVSIKKLKIISDQLRRDSLNMTTSAGSGHPTSCLSSAELISCLFFGEMEFQTSDPHNPNNDEFVLSKGHAAPILYSALSHAGCIHKDLLSLRDIHSPLEGHPMPHSLSWIKVATGSLGQGLSVGVGMALAGKIKHLPFRTYVLLGDSELAEGSNYEAMQLAAHYKLHNLCAIVDINKLGQSGETMIGHNLKIYKKRFESFGWKAIVINGHKIRQILKALKTARRSYEPTVILAKTVKGKGVSFLEGKSGWHGRALTKDELSKALNELPEQQFPEVSINSPERLPEKPSKTIWLQKKNYSIGQQISTRESFGDALAFTVGADPDLVVLDAEVGNSTFTEKSKEVDPSRFFQTYIAEQNMIGIAQGLSAKGLKPVSATFAAFLSRAHDQIRMSAVSESSMIICGSHAGISIGQDGASQMGLEDISLFRALPNSTILYPSDAISTQALTLQSANLPGIVYIRTSRPALPVLYSPDEEFPLGKFKILAQSRNDRLVLIGSGVTLHESLKAHHKLKGERINSAVIDLYSIKPFDSEEFLNFLSKHGNAFVIAEDHRPEGGIGEMLSSQISGRQIKFIHLSVNEIPHSGKPNELLARHKIDSSSIVDSAKLLLKSPRRR